ncbi:MAG: Na+/H+ antiporter NhaA [Pseudomonadota bacterium]
MTDTTKDDRNQERAAGLLLIAAAAVALFLANSPLADAWHHLLDAPLNIVLPKIGMLTPHLFVADGLMAIFFLLVGLEVKREWYEGRLSTPSERRLPIIAAAFGMAVPAMVYLLWVDFEPGIRRGWAIPAATDIAFAIGLLALLGPRVPPSIKLLLVTIAIVDDIGAVLVIALAYTAELNVVALGAALALATGMAALGQFGVRKLWPFLIGFALLWLLVLASGVHATIAGVVAALTIPLGRGEPVSPLKRLEHAIHPWVMFGVVPLFGLVSAGVTITGGLDAIGEPIPMGILLGLFVGKQLGVFGAIWAAIKLGLATQPFGTNWMQLYGAAVLCGIGFTMSLFIGGLAWPGRPELVDAAKVGTLAGSLLAALLGYVVLRFAHSSIGNESDAEQANRLWAAEQDDRESAR